MEGSPLARANVQSKRGSISTQGESFAQADSDSLDAVPSCSATTIDEVQRRREAMLRQHVFFQLRIHLVSGHNLRAMDKSGTSDPYVKFKMNGRLLHKSKTVYRDLNPVWDETFVVPIEDPFQQINIKVFDYDWGLQDDFIGSAQLDLTTLELSRLHELAIKLVDLSHADVGELKMNVTLYPRTQEDKEQVSQSAIPSFGADENQFSSTCLFISIFNEAHVCPKCRSA